MIAFLVSLGFEETVVYGEGDRVDHAQLDWPEGGGVMMGSHKPEGEWTWTRDAPAFTWLPPTRRRCTTEPWRPEPIRPGEQRDRLRLDRVRLARPRGQPVVLRHLRRGAAPGVSGVWPPGPGGARLCSPSGLIGLCWGSVSSAGSNLQHRRIWWFETLAGCSRDLMAGPVSGGVMFHASTDGLAGRPAKPQPRPPRDRPPGPRPRAGAPRRPRSGRPWRPPTPSLPRRRDPVP